MTNFEVGEVQTSFHTIRVQVSAHQGRLKKLQEGNHLKQNMQVTRTLYLQTEGIKVDRQSSAFQTDFCEGIIKLLYIPNYPILQESCKRLKESELPSEDGKFVGWCCEETEEYSKRLTLFVL